jgi:hypothetical protein
MKLIAASLLCLATAEEWASTVNTAHSRCYNSNKVHCIAEDFSHSACCDYPTNSVELARCMSQYHYCTQFLTTAAYREFTHPSSGCPENTPLIFTHESMESTEVLESSWEEVMTGQFCRMVFRASPELNGKIRVSILNSGETGITVYQQPNAFSSEYTTHGLLEN